MMKARWIEALIILRKYLYSNILFKINFDVTKRAHKWKGNYFSYEYSHATILISIILSIRYICI